MGLDILGEVSISCEAKRPWHQPRADGKRRRRWLAMFVIHRSYGDWMHEAVLSTRTYSRNNADGSPRFNQPAYIDRADGTQEMLHTRHPALSGQADGTRVTIRLHRVDEILHDSGEVSYRMECPCGYRIRDISSNELHPVLDQLSAGGVHSISIQRLLRILDRS